MPLNKQKVICRTSIIIVVSAVAIVLLGSSSAFALSLQPAIHQHNKVFDKKRQHGDGSSSSGGGSDTKSSDKSNNEDNSNNNNVDRNSIQGTNDGRSNSGAHNNLQSVKPTKTGKEVEGEGGSGENVAPSTGTTLPTPQSQTSCEQGSDCTDQQGLGDHDRSSTTTTGSATASKQNNNNNNSTPFVLSLPFP